MKVLLSQHLQNFTGRAMTSLGRGGPLDNHKYQFELSCVETREVIRSVLFMTHNKKIMKEKVDSIYKHNGSC